MKRILIHHNVKPFSIEVRDRLIDLLKNDQKEIVKNNPDVIVVIGGDGTMLSAIRKYRHLKKPFVGIDTGTLGFLTTIMPDHLEKIYEVLDSKNYRVNHYPLLSVRVRTVHGDYFNDLAFNEILIKHDEPRLMEAKIYLDGSPFNYFTGDGLIVSTPMGATGYAIWAGGAVVHSDIPVYQITPLTPNDNSVNRPLKSTMIVPENTKLQVTIEKANRRKVTVACDGIRLSDEYIESIEVRIDKEDEIRVIRSDEFNYFDLFKRKIIDKNILRFIE
ncbi:MAG: kinase [Clostridiales bacterium]|jgi:NAD+ kinase|nr:kinase [Clostridiales bacterium]MDN5300147.1 kinase [Clostridiales bacterium]